jgi:hypothetical protein
MNWKSNEFIGNQTHRYRVPREMNDGRTEKWKKKGMNAEEMSVGLMEQKRWWERRIKIVFQNKGIGWDEGKNDVDKTAKQREWEGIWEEEERDVGILGNFNRC